MPHPHTNGLLPRSPEELDTLLSDVRLHIESLLASEFGTHEWAIRSPAQLTALGGGKHVRARAFLAAALAYGATDDAALVEIGAAIELLHTSSLVHDDIIDASSQRRGEPTLHRDVIVTLAWIALILSGMLEAVWATTLDASKGFRKLWPTVTFLASYLASMAGLAYAMSVIPVGTAYAVWVGIGAVLTAAWAMLTKKDRATVLRVALLAGLIACVVGLKAVS